MEDLFSKWSRPSLLNWKKQIKVKLVLETQQGPYKKQSQCNADSFRRLSKLFIFRTKITKNSVKEDKTEIKKVKLSVNECEVSNVMVKLGVL